jgi:hypothetical protein
MEIIIQASPMTIGGRQIVVEMKRTNTRGKWEVLFCSIICLVELFNFLPRSNAIIER